MKKILIVGELTQKTADINQYLAGYFTTQICGDNPSVAASMMSMFEPDLVLMNIDGFEFEKHRPIYIGLSQAPSVPVLTCGAERKTKLFADYYATPQFVHISEPYSGEDIAIGICKMLNLNPDEIMNAGSENSMHHILVVDDNAVLLRNMKSMLSGKYKVSLATSAAQCMKVLGKGGVELILLDYEMPVVDGRQTLEMIRSDEELKDMPVIFLTGITDKAHVDLLIDLKPQGYFVKPPVQEKLVKAIDAILEPG